MTVPNIKMHLDNNIAWLKALDEQESSFKEIRGLVITGWQRYDHLATLCELLPVRFHLFDNKSFVLILIEFLFDSLVFHPWSLIC